MEISCHLEGANMPTEKVGAEGKGYQNPYPIQAPLKPLKVHPKDTIRLPVAFRIHGL